MFVHGKGRAQTKQKPAQGKAGTGERLGLQQSAGAILECLSTVNGSCSILKCILMALELRHFINTWKKTWEMLMGRGPGAENPGNILCYSAAYLLWWSNIMFYYCDGKFQFIVKAKSRFPSEAQFRLSRQIPLKDKKREREKMKVFILHYWKCFQSCALSPPSPFLLQRLSQRL